MEHTNLKTKKIIIKKKYNLLKDKTFATNFRIFF